MRKVIISVFVLFFIVSCGDENSQLNGEWVEVKNPENIWKLEATGSKITGTRVSGEDMYNSDTESWSMKKEKGVVFGQSTKDKDGSTLTYFPDKDKVLRTPPGILYKRR